MLSLNQHLLNARNTCVAACNEYFAGNLAAPGGVAQVRGIPLSRDCADLRQLGAAMVARGSGQVKFLPRGGIERCLAPVFTPHRPRAAGTAAVTLTRN